MIMGWSALVFLMTSVLLVASNETTDTEDVIGPIFISPKESEVVLQAGQNYTITCRANRPIEIQQQDIPEEITSEIQDQVLKQINEHEYEVSVTLMNVDHSAVGYYGCFDRTIDPQQVLKEIDQEPSNTNHISYIYIYVNGTKLFAPMTEFILAENPINLLIKCKPTTPDIKVTLIMAKRGSTNVKYEGYNPKIGFTVSNNVFSDVLNDLMCEYKRDAKTQSTSFTVIKHVLNQPPPPQITGGSRYFLEGETFSLNCTVDKQRNSAIELKWTIPGSISKVDNHSNTNTKDDRSIWYNNYTISNASREDAGNYTCTSKNVLYNRSQSFWKEYLDGPVIDWSSDKKSLVLSNTKLARVKINVHKAYPPPVYSVLKNNEPLPNIPNKYILSSSSDAVMFTIRNMSVEDSDNYTVVATNTITKSITFDIRLKGGPKITPEPDKTALLHTFVTLVCEVIAYPEPKVDWIFSDGFNNITFPKYNQMIYREKLYLTRSELRIEARVSGNITCVASVDGRSAYSTRQFFVQEMPDGFGIQNMNHTWFAENENVVIKCLASVYEFENNITWYKNAEPVTEVEYSENAFSYIATMLLYNITLEQAGRYTCKATKIDGTDVIEDISITVSALKPPVIEEADDQTEEAFPFQPFNFTCKADAVPPPNIEWYKDHEKLTLDDDSKIEISEYRPTKSSLISTLRIALMSDELAGKYECRVLSNGQMRSKFYTLALKEKSTNKTMYLIVIGVIFFLLILLVAYLTWKIRKERQFRKELAAAGLLYFKEGVKKSINPDLGIDEQAELLPYDDKFEFPADKLILGKQLGAGAFGVVYKAEARGIINAEETTTVAVKMVKKTADNMYIKALASELKIMVHLGKHINIVNLLGACTKNVGKRELIVIVEYCKFGNIHNYLQKHREVFIDQLNENSEKTMGKVNRGYSCSSGGSNSDYFGSTHTQNTDNTFLNTANTNRSFRKDKQNKQSDCAKVSESGYLQPEWRSNYESDYNFEGRSPRPLCSRDLLAWAFQIARGMEYLASRKVLHGDLAARNILLAEDNIVKICDFGLARSIYKNDEYQKKENSPLPVKWLAIECMTDRIFSTQSDVWSFGIVLWELFSLAKTPYPNISPPSLLQWLSDGNRLDKPRYADDRIYEVMKSCWNQKPNARPSFGKLQETLGSFLEDHVRNHYVDLNSMYADMNSKREEAEDYLAMVSAPDYNNMVAPSPHHYVNETTTNFFPIIPNHDDEGYLPMSPGKQKVFNARVQGSNKFDFDARKLSPRASEPNSYGSESTPMLTLNNLPRSGSESDHEGSTSPYMNMCPRIEEESDEVFEMKQNNAKNIQHAVTNPTYITFTADDEKKPKNFSNTYTNINGLVK